MGDDVYVAFMRPSLVHRPFRFIASAAFGPMSHEAANEFSETFTGLDIEESDRSVLLNAKRVEELGLVVYGRRESGEFRTPLDDDAPPPDPRDAYASKWYAAHPGVPVATPEPTFVVVELTLIWGLEKELPIAEFATQQEAEWHVEDLRARNERHEKLGIRYRVQRVAPDADPPITIWV